MWPDDRVLMLHIRDASDSVARFVAGRQRGDLDSDEMLLFALVRAIEIIGEAASRVSDETRQAFPAVPWSEVVAMRNRLAACASSERCSLFECIAAFFPSRGRSPTPSRIRPRILAPADRLHRDTAASRRQASAVSCLTKSSFVFHPIFHRRLWTSLHAEYNARRYQGSYLPP